MHCVMFSSIVGWSLLPVATTCSKNQKCLSRHCWKSPGYQISQDESCSILIVKYTNQYRQAYEKRLIANFSIDKTWKPEENLVMYLKCRKKKIFILEFIYHISFKNQGEIKYS